MGSFLQLLVIAHRIRTVISYDRILVLSPHDPQVEALDTPLVLFDQEGTFHVSQTHQNYESDICSHSFSLCAVSLRAVGHLT